MPSAMWKKPVKKLHAVGFQLYDFLETVKLWRQ